jgi:hypothetical protein
MQERRGIFVNAYNKNENEMNGQTNKILNAYGDG